MTSARPNDAALQGECGALGVMAVPAGVDASTVRHCAEHSLGREHVLVASGDDADNTDDLAQRNVDIDLTQRDTDDAPESENTPESIFGTARRGCNKNMADYGCQKGYCWRQCVPGSGAWCWLAEGSGRGPWVRCSYASQCRYEGNCGVGCAACGCSC
ncbi:hypothetical protein EK21DRAFT_73783 [Setomelanomma holmii]|uniref:Uncharacterized protein n=1 Tax=Setomelanomma holmii TaxID=210430 RepID=A0A9P4LII8_9PLEO|nr:hypothetical protein EK21DRAFT_73783 [Setomelanomma holmii]